MKLLPRICLSAFLLVGCDKPKNQPNPAADPVSDPSVSLLDARKGFKTKPIVSKAAAEPMPEPPAKLFRMVRYDAPPGKLPAYLTPDPKDGKKHPAIIWITGGDCNSIDEGCWKEGTPENDQSAGAFRKAGIVMMFPSLRGGNGVNPGVKEGFFGEVDDVLAAREYLSKQEYVDPKRIYLGGHSTGGTLVFLVAAASDQFRAVFSFGPAENVKNYPPQYAPFNTADKREVELRSPIRWLHSIQSPLFVLEGVDEPGNLDSLQALARASKNPLAHFIPVDNANHFSILGPTNRLLASKILRDQGPTCNITVTEEEVDKLFQK